jgi:hypothetical protein
MSSSAEQHFQKVLKWFERGEVKTPLSFFFKVLPWLTGAWGLILYSPIPVDMKMHLIKLSALVFGGCLFSSGASRGLTLAICFMGNLAIVQSEEWSLEQKNAHIHPRN